MENYFNTTNKKGKDLQDSEKKAVGQNKLIMEYFTLLKKGNPTDVWEIMFTPKTPLTSIRRGITTLTKAGYLEKTNEMVPGFYGDPEHIWKLKPQPGKQTKLF